MKNRKGEFPPLSVYFCISASAIRSGSFAACTRSNHLLVTDCYVFNEPKENKKFKGCRATRVCCSVCQIHTNADSSQMFFFSFVKEIYVWYRAQKSLFSMSERPGWYQLFGKAGWNPSQESLTLDTPVTLTQKEITVQKVLTLQSQPEQPNWLVLN